MTDAIGRELVPERLVLEDAEQRFGDGLLVQRIDEKAIATIGEDIDRTAVFGRHHGQTTGGCFEQGEPEGLGQRGIDEHSPTGRCTSVEKRHILRAVMLGDRDLPIEVITIDADQQIGEHRLCLLRQLTQIVTVACDNHQIGNTAQPF